MKKIAVCLLCLMALAGCGQKQERWVKLHETKESNYFGDTQSLNREKHTAWIKKEHLNDLFKHHDKVVSVSLYKINADCENGKLKIEDVFAIFKDGKRESVTDFDGKSFNIIPESSGEYVYKWLCNNEVKKFK